VQRKINSNKYQTFLFLPKNDRNLGRVYDSFLLLQGFKKAV